MSTPTPYGSWKSPITSDLIVSDAVRLGGVQVRGDEVFWIEGRASEGGRCTVMRRRADGTTEELTPAPFNARTRVHEYGGGAYCLGADALYASNFADQQLYRVSLEQGAAREPTPVTHEEGLRYADGVVDDARQRLICVQEDHRAGGEPFNRIVSLDLSGESPPVVIAEGNDFYASPRLSTCGTRVAWITWDHPHMPWDTSELLVTHLDADGSPGLAERVAGDPSVSLVEPCWLPDRELVFASDRGNWWNLHRYRDGASAPICPREAEFSRPHWTFGQSSYAVLPANRLACSWTQRGNWKLGVLDLSDGVLRELETPFSEISYLQACGGRLVFVGASPTRAAAVIRLDPESGELEELARSSEVTVDEGFLSAPEAVEFPTADGRSAHGLFYRPRNADHVGADGERPPLLVLSHGGPTSAASGGLSLGTQYWTSRGFAVLDVNYGGSCGYGREYRQRLQGEWGLVDVQDCARGAAWLVERGEVDAERLAIRGGSAGGYTTLCALTFDDTFKAGASHFGVSDLEALAKDTHKFESRYLDGLIGPYPGRRDLYQARSPIHHTAGLDCPLILFQGLEDAVVPPSQAELMAEALRAKGLPVAYLPFEGEQHGFRKAENIKRCLDAELYFYGRVFGFELAEPVEPVAIDNLPETRSSQ